MAQLRTMHTGLGLPLLENFRPPQALNGRAVLKGGGASASGACRLATPIPATLWWRRPLNGFVTVALTAALSVTLV